MPRKEYVLRSELFVKVGYFSFMPRTEYGLRSEVGGELDIFLSWKEFFHAKNRIWFEI